MTVRAAGALLVARTGKALFLRRADTGLWAFPGGHIEDGETAEQAAERELAEEIGAAGYDALKPWTRRIKDDGQGEVDFTTFAGRVNDEFIPELNEEHTAWTWAGMNDPPQPLHPGAAIALAKFDLDELGIARAIAAGDLTSPQQYGNFWLWAIRITGTGAAYRDAHNEYCWRPADIWLTEYAADRCAGLPVIFVHPEDKPTLDSDEFHERIVGTVFVPFVRDDDLWAVCRIYDESTIAILNDGEFSTSPGVAFNEASGNQSLKLKDGTNLLIEGKPALLDHIALVPRGVWDKGGPPAGVETRNDSSSTSQEPVMAENTAAATQARNDTAKGDPNAKLDAILDMIGGLGTKVTGLTTRLDAMDEAEKREEKEREDRERRDRARKDRFGARQDGESDEDYKKRMDADEAAMCDALRRDGCGEDDARKDAAECRADAESEDRRMRDDRARRDADEAAHKAAEELDRRKKEEEARKDAATVRENDDLKRQIAALQAQMTGISAVPTRDEMDALAAAQTRADTVFSALGERASAAVRGEKPMAYRRRLAAKIQHHSPQFAHAALDVVDDKTFEAIETAIYHDAMQAALSPASAPATGLRAIVKNDGMGHTITEYVGDVANFIGKFKPPVQQRARDWASTAAQRGN